MPMYEYHCQSCSESFTVREAISKHREGKATCPKCQSRKVERVFSEFYAKTPRKS